MFLSCTFGENYRMAALVPRHNLKTYLFCFTEVCDMSVIIGSPHIEAGTSPLTTKPRYKTRFSLTMGSIYCSYLHTPTYCFEEPCRTINTVSLEVYMKRSVPVYKYKYKCLGYIVTIHTDYNY